MRSLPSQARWLFLLPIVFIVMVKIDGLCNPDCPIKIPIVVFASYMNNTDYTSTDLKKLMADEAEKSYNYTDNYEKIIRPNGFNGKIYNGISADFPADPGALSYKIHMSQIMPVVYKAQQEAKMEYSVAFDPVIPHFYNPCVGNLAWESLRKFTDRLLEEQPVVYIGPPCTADITNTGFALNAFGANNTVMMTGGTTLAPFLHQFGPTVMRCNFGSYTQWSIFLAMCRMYQWSFITILVDDRDSKRPAWASFLQKRLTAAGINSTTVYLDVDSNVSFVADIADDFSRVFVVLAPCCIRNFMLEMLNSGRIETGEYIVFTMEQLPKDPGSMLTSSDPLRGNWKIGQSDDEIAKTAYESLYVFALPNMSGSKYKDIERWVRDVFNNDSTNKLYYQSNYVSNYFMASFYDCLMILARALEAAYNAEMLGDRYPINGFQTNGTVTAHDARVKYYSTKKSLIQQYLPTILQNYVANLPFHGASGNVTLKSNLDRWDDFVLLGMTDTGQGTYDVMAKYDGSKDIFTTNNKMRWPTLDGTPTKNTPPCSFTNDQGYCAPAAVQQRLIITISAGMGVPVFLVFAGWAIMQIRKVQQLKKADQSWIAKWDDLKVLPPPGAVNVLMSINKEGDKEKALEKKLLELPGDSGLLNAIPSETASHKTADIRLTQFISTWKKQAVTVRWSRKRHIKLNTTILKEARLARALTSEYVMHFKGACLEDEHIMIIYECCGKGSLSDVLADPNIKLEWTLRFSFISDCMKGLSYLHHSALKIHGRLTSMCCFVDSRFMLKISDYGFDSLFTLTLAELWAAKREPEYFLNQMWKAPEHIKAEAYSRFEVVTSKSAKGDVYSFAIIVQEIVLRSKPFAMYPLTDEMIVMLIKDSANENQPRFIPKIDLDACPAALIDLCDQCWAVDPIKRPAMVHVRAQLRELGKLMGVGERSNILDTLLHQMEDMEVNLNHIVEEKGQLLLIQKNQSDKLLYSVLPSPIAETMKKSDKPRTESFDVVTVLHCDIPDYYEILHESTSIQMIEFVQDLNIFYEYSIEKYETYKVQSSKNVLMVVCGLPRRNKITHAREISRLALEFLFRIHLFRIAHRPELRLSIRIGIHSGGVVAGVVGVMVPRYLLFGDTVGISSQMLSSGEKMKIQLSWMTKKALEGYPNFDLQERGEVFVKGKGAMKTFWLLGENDNPELEEMRAVWEKYMETGMVMFNANEQEEARPGTEETPLTRAVEDLQEVEEAEEGEPAQTEKAKKRGKSKRKKNSKRKSE